MSTRKISGPGVLPKTTGQPNLPEKPKLKEKSPGERKPKAESKAAQTGSKQPAPKAGKPPTPKGKQTALNSVSQSAPKLLARATPKTNPKEASEPPRQKLPAKGKPATPKSADAPQKQAAEREAVCKQLLQELRCIALGEKGYPVYDKNGEESLALPTMQARLKALELLGKHYALFAAEEPEETDDGALEVEIHVV